MRNVFRRRSVPGIAAFLVVVAGAGAAQSTDRLEFEPRVGVVGHRVTLKGTVPVGAQLLFGGKPIPYLRDEHGVTFAVPDGVPSGFLELALAGKVLSRSSVPFVVAGRSIVSAPKLVGLKEAIDVFGYVDPVPEGGGAPEPKAKPIFTFGADSILTLGETPPSRLEPAVTTGDAASAARSGMGQPGFILTVRPPSRRPTPTPSAQ